MLVTAGGADLACAPHLIHRREQALDVLSG